MTAAASGAAMVNGSRWSWWRGRIEVVETGRHNDVNRRRGIVPRGAGSSFVPSAPLRPAQSAMTGPGSNSVDTNVPVTVMRGVPWTVCHGREHSGVSFQVRSSITQ